MAGAKAVNYDGLCLLAVDIVFNYCVFSIRLSVHMKDCSLGTHFIWCTEIETLRIKTILWLLGKDRLCLIPSRSDEYCGNIITT